MKQVERIIILYPADINSERMSKPGNYSLSRLLILLHERGDVPIYYFNKAARHEQFGNIEFIQITLRNLFRLLRTIVRRRNTLVIMQMGAYHRTARIIRAVLPGARVLVRLGGVYYKKEYLESPAFRGEARALRRRLALADMIISTADGTPVDLFMEKVGVKPERYRKWLNGFPVIPNDGNNERGDRIVCIARLHRGKAVDSVLRAYAAALPRLKRPHTLRIVGDGPQQSELQELARELGVADRVEFVGHSDDVGPHLYSSKVLVSGLANNPLMEAIATGTPIITAEWGEVKGLYGAFPHVHVVECPNLGFGPGPIADTAVFESRTADKIVELLNDYPCLDSQAPPVAGLRSWYERLTDELELCDSLMAPTSAPRG
jgi:glycosyltransferase involved in cell wall biosynthesis